LLVQSAENQEEIPDICAPTRYWRKNRDSQVLVSLILGCVGIDIGESV
jgi:hypothetical protein